MGNFQPSFYEFTYKRCTQRPSKPVVPVNAAQHVEIMLNEKAPIPDRIRAMNAVAVALGQKVPPGDCLGDFCVKFRQAFVF